MYNFQTSKIINIPPEIGHFSVYSRSFFQGTTTNFNEIKLDPVKCEIGKDFLGVPEKELIDLRINDYLCIPNDPYSRVMGNW